MVICDGSKAILRDATEVGMFGKTKNGTMFNTSKPIWPTFPIQCVECEATHQGDLTRAIADGWHITVYDTRDKGHVQFAGCPKHTDDCDGESLAFLKGYERPIAQNACTGR